MPATLTDLPNYEGALDDSIREYKRHATPDLKQTRALLARDLTKATTERARNLTGIDIEAIDWIIENRTEF